MRKVNTLLAALIFASGLACAEPVLDEETVQSISDEFFAAIKSADMSVYEKYMFEGSRIVIDTDPDESAGQMQIPYDEFMALTAFAMSAMQNAAIRNETLSVEVDEQNNQATIKEKTIAVVEMMGVKVRDESVSMTTYGVVDGHIKVLSTEDQLISSEIIE